MWFITPEQLAIIEERKGPEPRTCGICACEISFDKLYLSVDATGYEAFGKKFHSECIVSHFYLHVDDVEDEVLNYILKVT